MQTPPSTSKIKKRNFRAEMAAADSPAETEPDSNFLAEMVASAGSEDEGGDADSEVVEPGDFPSDRGFAVVIEVAAVFAVRFVVAAADFVAAAADFEAAEEEEDEEDFADEVRGRRCRGKLWTNSWISTCPNRK